MIIFGMIGELDHAFCSPYIFCTRSQRVAALVSQIQITVRRASLSRAHVTDVAIHDSASSYSLLSPFLPLWKTILQSAHDPLES